MDGEEVRRTGRDTLDTTTTRQSADGGLGYSLDVVAENLSVTLGAAFAETFATFAACGREESVLAGCEVR